MWGLYRAIIAAGCVSLVLPSPSWSGSGQSTRELMAFHGTVVAFSDGSSTLDLGNVRARIHADYDDKCSAASGCEYIWVEVRPTDDVASKWKRVPIDPFNFPSSNGFWNDVGTPNNSFMDYPHMYEDYNQAVVVAREQRDSGSALAVYVASRDIGYESSAGPVDIVKFELVQANGNDAARAGVGYHLAPLASLRSKAKYNNAQLALFCEIGLETPGLRTNLSIRGAIECPQRPRK